MRITVAAGSASREVGALVLDDLLKYIVQDGFGIIRVVNRSGDSEDVTTLAHIVLDIFVVALVRELCEFDLFGGELFIEIVEIEAWRRQVFDAR